MWMWAAEGLETLVSALRARGYRVIAPVERDGSIAYDEIESARELPTGIRDVQQPGRYRLERHADGLRFSYAVGSHSWKRYLFPPSVRLFSVRREGTDLSIDAEPGAPERYAFIGVRACELRAIEMQDRVFVRASVPDATYASLRERCFVVAVQCSHAASTCFCVSAEAGPRAAAGFDLALTEWLEGDTPVYAVEVGSDAGAELLDSLPARPASELERVRALQVSEQAARQMRSLPAGDLRAPLAAAREHPRWDDVAERCLGCGNCTLVCPTCFCTRVEDATDLATGAATRTREWDSCFSWEFSHLHGGDVRTSTRSRYRQWLTHKLGTWRDQFESSGCVGCGRCLTWCPVGIDLTEEARALCGSDTEIDLARASVVAAASDAPAGLDTTADSDDTAASSATADSDATVSRTGEVS